RGLKIRASGRLLPAEAREPRVVIGQAREQRLDFAELAALVRRGLVQDSELGFLISYALVGLQVDQVQFPLRSHLIAIGQRFWKMIAGFEEQHGDIRPLTQQHVDYYYVLGLEAGRYTGAWGVLEDGVDEELGGF